MEALLANFDKIPKTNTKIPLPITLKTSTPFNKRKEKEMTLDLKDTCTTRTQKLRKETQIENFIKTNRGYWDHGDQILITYNFDKR